MALHIHHGPQLAPLAAGLARRLAAPGGDPFEALVVAVPTAGVRDWLTRRLAGDLGIVANVAMPFPGRFFADALGLAEDDPWHVERLTWAVLDTLKQGSSTCPAGTLSPTRNRREAKAQRRPSPGERREAKRSGGRARGHDEAAVRRRPPDRRSLRPLRDDPAGDPPPVAARCPRRRHDAGGWRRRSDGGGRRAARRCLTGVDALAVRAVGAGSPPRRLPRSGRAPARTHRGAPARRRRPGAARRRRGVRCQRPDPPATQVLAALGHVRDVHVSLLHPSAVAWSRTAPIDPVAATVAAATARPRSPLSSHPAAPSWGRQSSQDGGGRSRPAGSRRRRDDERPSPARAVHAAGAPPGPIPRRPSADTVRLARPSTQASKCTPATDDPPARGAARRLGHLFVADASLRPG